MSDRVAPWLGTDLVFCERGMEDFFPSRLPAARYEARREDTFNPPEPSELVKPPGEWSEDTEEVVTKELDFRAEGLTIPLPVLVLNTLDPE